MKKALLIMGALTGMSCAESFDIVKSLLQREWISPCISTATENYKIQSHFEKNVYKEKTFLFGRDDKACKRKYKILSDPIAFFDIKKWKRDNNIYIAGA